MAPPYHESLPADNPQNDRIGAYGTPEKRARKTGTKKGADCSAP
jgi:hypothetical protein